MRSSNRGGSLHLAAAAAWVLGVLIAFASLTGSAPGATYDVQSCGRAPAGGADDAWTLETTIDADHLVASAVCPPTGQTSPTFPYDNANGGVVLTDRLAAPLPDPVPGTYARRRFTAPSGTTIRHLSLQRTLGKRGESFRLFTRLADNSSIDADCTIPGGADRCVIGGVGSAYREVDVNTTSVTYGFECTAYQGGVRCPTGATLHEVWAVLYGSTVTIEDLGSPTLTNVGGPLFASPDTPKSGTLSATLDATDATGIKELRIYVDGVRRVTLARACDFSRARPCTDPPAQAAVTLDTTTVSNGTHTLEVAVADAAGNETRSSATTLTVFNLPAGGGGSGGGGGGGAPGSTAPAPPAVGLPAPSDTGGLPTATIDPPRPAARRLPLLRVSSVRFDRRTRRLIVTGQVTSAAQRSVVVTLTARGRTLRRTSAARSGRWRVTTIVPTSLVSAGRARLSVRYPGDSRLTGRSVVRTIRLAGRR